MPGFVVHAGAVVLCVHGGQAQPTVPNPRVMVSGQPVVTMATPYAVIGCPFAPVAPSPCVTAQWLTGSTRVLCSGQPLVLMDSQAICAPNGTPLLIVSAQPRVAAQ